MTLQDIESSLKWFYISIGRIAQDVLCCADPALRNSSSSAFHVPQRGIFLFDRPAELGAFSFPIISKAKQEAVAWLKSKEQKAELPSPIHVAYASTYGLQQLNFRPGAIKSAEAKQENRDQDGSERGNDHQRQGGVGQKEDEKEVEVEFSPEETEKLMQVKLKPRSEWKGWRSLATDALAMSDDKYLLPFKTKEGKQFNFYAPLTRMRAIINKAPDNLEAVNAFKREMLDI